MARRRINTEAIATQFKPGQIANRNLAEAQAKAHAMKRFSLHEARLQRRLIEDLMIKGLSPRRIVAIMKNPDKVEVPCGSARTLRIFEQIKQTWDEENKKLSEVKKGAAERRLIEALEQARGEVNPQTGRWKNPNFAAIASLEKLLADIQNTRAPVKVQIEHQVSIAMMSVIAEMSPQRVQEIMAQQAEIERDAEYWRRSLPAAKKTG